MVLCIGFEPLITRSNQITAGRFTFTAVFLWGGDAPVISVISARRVPPPKSPARLLDPYVAAAAGYTRPAC